MPKGVFLLPLTHYGVDALRNARHGTRAIQRRLRRRGAWQLLANEATTALNALDNNEFTTPGSFEDRTAAQRSSAAHVDSACLRLGPLPSDIT